MKYFTTNFIVLILLIIVTAFAINYNCKACKRSSYEGMTSSYLKVGGFKGLQKSTVADEQPIDIYSEANSSLTCESSGLHNSMGNLCLDKNQLALLTSRGGNAV